MSKKFDTLYEEISCDILLSEEIQKLEELCITFSKENILKQFGKAGFIVIVTALGVLGAKKAHDMKQSIDKAMTKGIERAESLGKEVDNKDELKKAVRDIYNKNTEQK